MLAALLANPDGGAYISGTMAAETSTFFYGGFFRVEGTMAAEITTEAAFNGIGRVEGTMAAEILSEFSGEARHVIPLTLPARSPHRLSRGSTRRRMP